MKNTAFLISMSIIIVTFFVIVIIFKIYVDNNKVEQKIIPYSKYLTSNGENYKKCPVGCKRGICEKRKTCNNYFPPSPECCAHDYQCSYCDSSETESSFISPGSTPAFSQALDDANPNNMSSINNLVKKQNKYIINVNKQIVKDNKYYNQRLKAIQQGRL